MKKYLFLLFSFHLIFIASGQNTLPSGQVTFKIKVLDQQGNPIPGCSVDWRISSGNQVVKNKADNQGNCSFTVNSPDIKFTVTATAHHPGYISCTAYFGDPAFPEQRELSATLKPIKKPK